MHRCRNLLASGFRRGLQSVHAGAPIGRWEAKSVPSLLCVSKRAFSGFDHVVVNSSKDNYITNKLDDEKELFSLKRALSAQFTQGNYDLALRTAVELSEKCKELYGRENPIFASSLSNIALMQKMLGEYDAAITKYIEALHLFEEIEGTRSTSYASTLSNLGTLYRLRATETTGMAQITNLQRADEALTDSLKLREQLLGPTHRDTINSQILLAGLRRAEGKVDIAIEMTLKTLAVAKELFTDQDSLVGTIENNLGLAYKEKGDFNEARARYVTALEIRSRIFGDAHQETIVVMHNLAECLMAMNRPEEARVWQEKILQIIGPQAGQPTTAAPSASSSSSAAPASGTGSSSHSPQSHNGGTNPSTETEKPTSTTTPPTPPKLFTSPVSQRSTTKRDNVGIAGVEDGATTGTAPAPPKEKPSEYKPVSRKQRK